MIELSTYVFETLREDGELVLYRGRRQDEGSRLLAAESVSERPSVRILDQLEHEYSMDSSGNKRACWSLHTESLRRG